MLTSTSRSQTTNSQEPRKEQRVITWKEARKIARGFVKYHPEILGVEVFGSIARKREGNDIDFLLCVPDELSKKFFEMVRQEINAGYYGSAGIRGAIAFLHCITEEQKYSDFDAYDRHLALCSGSDDLLDIFLVPQNWREKLEELQAELPHKDPNFMSNVAHDARVIA